MKILFTILFFTSTLVFSQSPNGIETKNDTILIKPGIGINGIQIGKSSEKEIETYRNWNFKKKNSNGIACGIGPSSYNLRTDYISESHGLRLEFKTKWEKDPEKLQKLQKNLVAIYLRQNENACLENGICIGKSSYEEVMEIMTNTKYEKKNYLGYPNKGLDFYFNSDGNLFSIKIYEPR